MENNTGDQSERQGASGLTLQDDQLYRALASAQRRRLLYVLLVEQESAVGKLATVLAGWDATEAGGMATPADREQILIALEHVHLPILAESGLVTYDRDDGTVRIEPLDDAVFDLICQSVETEPAPNSR